MAKRKTGKSSRTKPAARKSAARARPDREVYEKLGAFYLGRAIDPEGAVPGKDLFLYDSRDLVTHAVVVGMTGSGKTGLGTVILEEAALDGIPALIIDPKGDLSNLMLTFPDLRAEDFMPWIDPAEAGRQGLSAEAYAARQALAWSAGLEEWGQSGERIRRLREAAEVVVFTPGSRAGIPLSILHSLEAPSEEARREGDLVRERLQATVGGLLRLLGIDSDPIQGREHVFLANVIDDAWSHGHRLDLPGLIALVQAPPFDKIGVLDLEMAYPAAERSRLAMALNNRIAAPGFEVWLEGEPLDIPGMLWNRQGKPRLAIVSLAHLSEAERMFVTSLLLSQVVAWVRSQSGTDSLRAILFMDEIFGFFPPVAEPPSKKPMLTLLKSARAHGLGIVLATQNPIDLDYRGLGNAGTWFIGRLQTDRDKQRLLDGLDTVGGLTQGRWDRPWLEKAISSLEKRAFLVNNVHEDHPAALQTRWALSYLRGPMTRDQIQHLIDPVRARFGGTPAVVTPASAPPTTAAEVGQAPVVTDGVRQVFLPARPGAGPVTYLPRLLGAARLHFTKPQLKVNQTSDRVFLAGFRDAAIPVDWAEAIPAELDAGRLLKQPSLAGGFGEVAPAAMRASSYTKWEKDFTTWLATTQTLDLWRSSLTGVLSQPGESEADFRARRRLEAREGRDQAVEKLRRKYAAKLTSLQDRLRRAEHAVDREQEQARQQKTQTAISFGATVLGAFVGRKALSATTLGRATTAARGVSRSAKEQEDVRRAESNLEAMRKRLADLEGDLEAEVGVIEAEYGGEDETLEQVSVAVTKPKISVQLVALAWAPHVSDAAGNLTPAWG